jgi:trans-2,3-dihydro-3-hydroxyanthranilate isomerase
MTGGLRFLILDVFARGPLQGNQLAVFPEAAGLSGDLMQALAREMHFSETTFILDRRPNERGWPVRIFTPGREVPFAGHPTLGTAYVIWDRLLGRHADEVKLDLKVGAVPVRVEHGGSRLMMTQVQPEFGRTLSPADAAPALGLDPADIDPAWPVQEVSTGLSFLIVPVRSLAAVRRVKVNLAAHDALIAGLDAKAILVFSPETERTADLHVRVFCDYYAVPEDPATGSANGCLCAWLVRHRFFGRPDFAVRTEQGIEIGRPSELFLEGSDRDGSITVRVGGRVVPVASGRFNPELHAGPA